MRVALVQNVTQFDHRMVHIDNVARELTVRGHHVDVIINNSSQSIKKTSCPYKIISIPGETYSIFGQIRFVYNLYKLLRKKQYELAIGHIIGSCLVDATVSVGSGQLFFPQAVSGRTAMITGLYAIFGSILVVATLALRERVDKKAGALFILIYILSYTLLGVT